MTSTAEPTLYAAKHLPSNNEVATRLGVAPGAPPNIWKRKRAGFFFKGLLTLSHVLDPIKVPNSFVNYQCVWWKTLSGNDKSSPVCDHGLNYDLLPPITRWTVAGPLVHFYPRYHHANVELRTAYLDAAIDTIMRTILLRRNTTTTTIKRFRLVLLGAGYDLRCIRMAMKYENLGFDIDLIELDLPHVIRAKRTLLKKRLSRRRPTLKKWVDKIQTFEVDLNQTEQIRNILNNIILAQSEKERECYTVFVFEAVLVYLEEGIPSSLLRILSDVLQNSSNNGSVCFADVLDNVEDGDVESARKEFLQNGWVLEDFCFKPGKTRHMGWATI